MARWNCGRDPEEPVHWVLNRRAGTGRADGRSRLTSLELVIGQRKYWLNWFGFANQLGNPTGNAHNLQRETARRSPSDIKQSQPHILSAWGPARHDTSTGRCAAHVIGFRQMIGPPVPDRMMAREDVSTAVASATGNIQLYPLPFVYSVRSDLCEHLPTCGSAAIVRIQYPNMEKRVRLAGFTRILARKNFNI